ncbi:molybdopterin oxidoreductase family protein [Methylocaldum sp.]|uniref:molybdopterin-containing oxidoreductase family protein n=1 Tax=Methylocaldum sp. TaxID=1969727 RepID=UPI002D6E5AA3|nr:molybdopterin oxidoreductase family protein [Methylocaldum sp.]HYE37308.1 molybdopterin oxidoreductase family protein [Methylocaldum sp.]
MVATSEKKTVFGACPHDCPDTCAMLYEVENDRLVNVRGNPDHPFTRGGLCTKLKDFHDHHYNPERVLHPLRRVGPKGSRRFERISWDDALAEIKSRWTAIIDQYGAEAILPYNYLGNQGTLQGLTVGDAFFNKLGASVLEKTFCASGSSIAWLLTVGPTGGVDPESFAQSKYIVIWACNSVSTNLHHWHIVHEAQKNGAKVVVIDAYKSRTAKQADWHLAPKPGTDAALAMAMIHQIIADDLLDHDYIARYTVGFEELKARAARYTPEYAAEITGISADDIRKLSREYATTQPAAIRLGVALERHQGGGQTIRAVCCLPALTGAWRHVGGGLLQMPVWEFPVHWDRVCRPEWIKPGTRVINLLKLGDALTGRMPLTPPVKSLMVYNANPVSQAPETNKIVEGLKREDLFTVVSEHFITDTAAYADLVLPATMAGEMDDIMWSWGHFYLTLNQKAIHASGEAVPNTELFRRLAKVMGFDDAQFERSDRDMIEHYVDWNAPQLRGIDMAYLERQGYAHIRGGKPESSAPHAEGNFPTPSGKCEFKASGAAQGNFVAPVFRQMYESGQGGEPIDTLPDYVPCRERPESDPERAKRFPLNILSPKSHGFLNSCYANEEHKIRAQGEQFVLINPADAESRGINDGDCVKVFNDRGEFEADARVTEDTPPGVVVATLGYWRSRNRGNGSVNVISSASYCNLGHAPTFSDNLVEVLRSGEGG